MAKLLTVNDKTPQQLVLDMMVNGERRESLSEFTAATRLNPSALIERSLMNNLDTDVMSNIMQTCVGIYVSQYIQAFELSKDKGGVRAIDFLTPLSDDPYKSVRVAVPFGESIDDTSLAFPNFSGEAKVDHDPDISKPSNLAVGKQFMVSLDLDGDKKSIDIPINVTMSPRDARLEFMIDVVKHLNDDRDILSRWHKVWSGEINFFSDFLLNLDIIGKERRLLLTDDENGFYRESESKRAGGLFASFFSGQESINVASNFLVLSETGAARLAGAFGGSMDRYNDRRDIFRESGSMCMVIVNPMEERLKVYIRGFKRAKIYTFNDIKNFSSKSDALDVNALMKAYNMGGM